MGLIVYGGDSLEVRAQEVKIRKDNDFKLIFLVERNGNPENMDVATIISLNLIGPSSTVPVTPVLIENNILYIDIDSSLNQVLGKYSLELKYTIPDPEFTGGVRDCAVDTYAYTIVGSSSEATKIDELAKTVDVATGFQGKAFTYGMYTPEQIAELQRPALEAAILANNAVILANAKATEANNAAQAANTAAGLANSAATTANIAAGLADDARLAIQTDLDKKLESDAYSVPDNIQEVKKWVSGVKTAINVKTVPKAVINPETNKVSGYDEEETVAHAINVLAERLDGLELAFRNMTLTKVQTDTLDVLMNLNFQGRPLFVIGTTAPSTVPDGVPQFYINTTNGDLYSAKNSSSVSDWIIK